MTKLVLGRFPTVAPPPPQEVPSRRWTDPAVLLALAVLLIGAVWATTELRPDPPGEQSADVGFSRDMSDHHAQAVAMAELIRDRTDDPRIRTLATDISLTQQAQIGQMRGWLDAWQRPPTGASEPMAWMGHGDDVMPGMASTDEMGSLEVASGREADELFLRLMIRHHRGGLLMAASALSSADEDEVRALATAIRNGQAVEIEAMQDLLDSIGAEPETSAVTMGATASPADGRQATTDLEQFVPLLLVVGALGWLVADDRIRRRAWEERGARRTRPPEIHWTRYALAVVGLTELLLAVPTVLGIRRGDLGSLHLWRDLGVSDAALGVGLLVCALQPRRVFGLLPVGVALAVTSIGAAVVDLAQGQAGALGEAKHILELAGVGALLALARREREPDRGSRGADTWAAVPR